ncbi:MAG: hypothetical protein ACXW20_16335 [Burkholderiales bacterium]
MTDEATLARILRFAVPPRIATCGSATSIRWWWVLAGELRRNTFGPSGNERVRLLQLFTSTPKGVGFGRARFRDSARSGNAGKLIYC